MPQGEYFCDELHKNIALVKKQAYPVAIHLLTLFERKRIICMLTAMKNVFMSYLLSLAEVHPEVTRF
ncbi:MAG: hypothetical protein K0S62_3099 [Kosakonia cowanii]|nr:hypothetical protein BFG07_23190 [Kosakonia cowanii]MDF2625328.1 hypothetical protein [Kosakonia cowanii]